MGKYEPLNRHLKGFGSDQWSATFDEIESIIQCPLPKSARNHRVWWSNAMKGHSQSAAWIDAGWVVKNVDRTSKTVVFERRNSKRPWTTDDEMLWQKAEQVMGTKDRAALGKMALEQLLARYAGRELAKMGGTMPDAWAPARERPFS